MSTPIIDTSIKFGGKRKERETKINSISNLVFLWFIHKLCTFTKSFRKVYRGFVLARLLWIFSSLGFPLGVVHFLIDCQLIIIIVVDRSVLVVARVPVRVYPLDFDWLSIMGNSIESRPWKKDEFLWFPVVINLQGFFYIQELLVKSWIRSN